VTPHICHATGCFEPVQPQYLMCLRHWRQVPPEIRSRLWRHFRPGQDTDKNPSRAYTRAARDAIESVSPVEIPHSP
jgi:hypothetical protein